MKKTLLGYGLIIAGVVVHTVVCKKIGLNALKGNGLTLFVSALAMQMGGAIVGMGKE